MSAGIRQTDKILKFASYLVDILSGITKLNLAED
jgi:hypothetical protein